MRETLVGKINLSASRLKPYEGFIFLCGGPTDIRAPKPISVRDAIHRELGKDSAFEPRIRVAEDYKDWSHDATYRDLISFERHLAELSSVIVLVLESAGSIAELGLFSVIDEFKKKLLVFIETDHYTSESFIKLGPIDYLEKIYENNAECHRWMQQHGRLSTFDPEAAERLQPELADAVRARASQPTAERDFNSDTWLDVALLVCDLIGLCSALTLRELRQLLVDLGCPKTEAEVKQLLFLLQKVELIAMEPKGDQRFYISIEDKQYLQFSLRDKTFDAMRFRSDLLSHYEKSDKKRFRAIQDVRRRYA
ncbi:retron St85 family effector protein [Comamonas sp.]|uniref:retron St85 family effector protein n=1 Tax=Comamonas sp. TaxID=34028 RepID=UPI00289F7289|nr:retron St85 family effector protein [Comamonas sp.]